MKFTLLSRVPHAPLNTTAYRSYSRLDNVAREKMHHLRCICFVRPSAESIQYLIDEFREPKYGEYFICKVFHVE